LKVVPGYAGGDTAGENHAASVEPSKRVEAAQVTFDPRVITCGQILQIFFSVVHDPTQADARN
jgi:peptide-methionine (S)-S-oxide reductase